MEESKLLYIRKTWHQAYGWGFRLEIILQQTMLQFWVYLRGAGLAHNNGRCKPIFVISKSTGNILVAGLQTLMRDDLSGACAVL